MKPNVGFLKIATVSISVFCATKCILALSNDYPDIQATPANLRYEELQARTESFNRWPWPRITDIAEAGFYFTGAEDIVRCFFCDIGLSEWEGNNNPWEEHSKHSPDCEFLKNRKGLTYIEEVQRIWRPHYPPKYPNFNDTKTRLATFKRWPRDPFVQSPQELAIAGFFYIGVRDVVRCHHCGITLTKWNVSDDPWIEHARWSPNCKFTIKRKGIAFVRAVARAVEELHRANEQEQRNSATSQATKTFSTKKSYVETCERNAYHNSFVSAAAETLKFMGYKRDQVEIAINLYMISHEGRRDFKAEDLISILIDNDMDIMSEEDKNDWGIFEPSGDAARAEYRMLRNSFICTVCKVNERQMLFVPCGHRITCKECSDKIDECPTCKKKISEKYKTYL
ncbi:hypothetical protein CI610_03665 [invertebrate metagenome]|uniref:RING-type domain-containing protein n=1 Tax=invertebrate metagenome TaxID=1711999 RepID=A0A2H9T2G8_9ZZZZ